MIVEAICDLIFLVVNGLIRIFPIFPKLDMSGLDGIMQVFSMIDAFVSLRMVSYCLVAIFLFLNIDVMWGIIMWVIRKIPGVE